MNECMNTTGDAQKSSPLVSCVAFRSRNFMFASDRQKLRRICREEKGFVARFSSKNPAPKVSFAPLAEFRLYKEDPINIGEDIEVEMAYLITGHAFKHFKVDFLNLSETVWSNKDVAFTFWEGILCEGYPRIRSVEDDSEYMFTYNKPVGVVPLPPHIAHNQLRKPRITRDFSERLGDKEKSEEDGEKISKRRQKKKEKPHNVYLDYLQITEEVRENVVSELHIRNSELLYDTFVHLFEVFYKKTCSEESAFKESEGSIAQDIKNRYSLDGSKYSSLLNLVIRRENHDLKVLEEVVDVIERECDDFKQSEKLTDYKYQMLFKRFISLSLFLGVFKEVRAKSLFKKLCGSALLDDEETAEQALKSLQDIFNYLNVLVLLVAEAENVLRKAWKNDEEFDFDMDDSYFPDFFGRIVCPAEGRMCTDLFNGVSVYLEEDVPIEEARVFTSKAARRDYAVMESQSNRNGIDIMFDDSDSEADYPTVDVIAPMYFKVLKGWFQAPLDSWMQLKIKLMEFYVGLLNSATLIGCLNGREKLLNWVKQFQIPKIIVETSLITTEPDFALHTALCQSAQRTTGMLQIKRTDETSNVIAEHHWNSSYLPTPRKKSSGSVLVNAYSVCLNPIVRIDLYFSRKRRPCADDFSRRNITRCGCVHHKGFLLSTIIKLGNLKMVRFLIENGLNPNISMCTGRMISFSWDLPLGAKAKQIENRQMLGVLSSRRKKRRKKGSSHSNLKSNPLISMTKSLTNIVRSKPDKVDESDDVAQTVDNDNEDIRDPSVEADEVDRIATKRKSEESNRNLKTLERLKTKKDRSFQSIIKISREKTAKTSDLKKSSLNSLTSFSSSRHSLVSIQRDKTPIEFDKIRFMKDDCLNPVMKLEKQTPLSISVEYAVYDLYQNRTNRPREYSNDHPNERVRIVEHLLQYCGKTITSNNFAALRSCLPMLSPFSKMRLPKKKQRKYKHKIEKWMNKDFQYMDAIEKLRFQKYTAASNGVKVFHLITNHIANYLQKSNVRKASSFKGYYAALQVKVTLIHEAVLLQQWRIVRLLAGKKDSLRKKRQNLQTFSFRSKVLKGVFDLLLIELRKFDCTAVSQRLLGVYFLMKDLGLDLDLKRLRKLSNTIQGVLLRGFVLNPAVNYALQRVFSLEAVRCCMLDFEDTSNSSRNRTFRRSKKLRYSMHLCAGAVSHDMEWLIELTFQSCLKALDRKGRISFATLLFETATNHAKQLNLIAFLLDQIIDFNRSTEFPNRINQVNILNQVASKYFFPQTDEEFKLLVTEANSVAKTLLVLIENGASPGLPETKQFFINSIVSNPLLELLYTNANCDFCLVSDLSPFFLFRRMIDDVLPDVLTSLNDKKKLKHFILDTLQVLNASIKSDKALLWYEGLNTFFKASCKFHRRLRKKFSKPNNPLFGLDKRISKRMKWHIVIRPQDSKVVIRKLKSKQ